MLKIILARTLCKPSVLSSRQPIAELRAFGNAAFAFASLVVAALTTVAAAAQQAESTYRPGHQVAVIDVGYIFKNLSTITAQISKVEADSKKYEAELKQQQDALAQSVAQLKTLKVGTADFARQEERVATLQSKLQLDMKRKQQRLHDAEAKIYYDNYQRIATAVQAIATHNNIQLVLRFNSEKMDSKQRDSVARGVAKNVVYHDSTIDITNTVMRYLEQQTSRSHVATRRDAASATNR